MASKLENGGKTIGEHRKIRQIWISWQNKHRDIYFLMSLWVPNRTRNLHSVFWKNLYVSTSWNRSHSIDYFKDGGKKPLNFIFKKWDQDSIFADVLNRCKQKHWCFFRVKAYKCHFSLNRDNFLCPLVTKVVRWWWVFMSYLGEVAYALPNITFLENSVYPA